MSYIGRIQKKEIANMFGDDIYIADKSECDIHNRFFVETHQFEIYVDDDINLRDWHTSQFLLIMKKLISMYRSEIPYSPLTEIKDIEPNELVVKYYKSNYFNKYYAIIRRHGASRNCAGEDSVLYVERMRDIEIDCEL